MEKANAAVTDLSALARQAGTTLTAMSLAWTLQRPGITSVVLGPRTVAQFTQQLAAATLTLTAETLAAIDRLVPPGGVTGRPDQVATPASLGPCSYFDSGSSPARVATALAVHM
jgi:diketogulonate reductase-like aldo/keto reductase